MPFNKSKLTPEQLARWDWACEQYTQIMGRNLETGVYGADQDYIANVLSHTPGDPRSALFMRLLEGKLPLDYPPPLSYSQPWYDIVEVPGAHDVQIGNLRPDRVLINECQWKIIETNAAAPRLIEVAAHVQALIAQRNCPSSSPGDQSWIDEQLAALQDGELAEALDARPEFIVQYPYYPPYRLFLAPARRRGVRKWALKHRSDAKTLADSNPKVIQVLKTHAQALDEMRRELVAIQARGQAGTTQRGDTDRQIHLEMHLKQPASEDNDWIDYECDTWMLEKLEAGDGE